MRPETAAPFSRRTTWILVVVAVVSFSVAVGYAIFGGDLGAMPSTDGDAYSRSALGHRGFMALLKKLDITVVASQHESAQRAGDRGVLVVAEPQLADEDAAATLDRMTNEARYSLIVLPKRRGSADPEKLSWIDHSELVPESDANDVLAAINVGGTVNRELAAAVTFSTNEYELAPSFGGVTQLMNGASLEPVIAGDGGILLGRFAWGENVMYVLADPDLLANHGLADGDNAAIMVAIIEDLRGDRGGAVIIDETMHGHVSPPSLWRELLSFPLSLASASALLTVAMLLWAAMGRFGKAVTPAPAIEPGKAFLIDNTAELLRFGGHASHALERYLNATVQDVMRRSHAPSHVGASEQHAWLVRLGQARKVPTDLTALEREVAEIVRYPNAARALAAAGRIHRWRQEMTDGSAAHPGHR